ncbi:autotransporter outer membrane beta-barrel domain-containing protein [Trabulsiella odontotermitis]|uniref:Autotransport protein MisL n=2 Tax=Trabulsiella odontotermitis TaxID=379893 RepID=A0A0L0GZL5_9ENTR|nr:autotransporter outer membrane beta-barrel domain-containing protein [Trabulsiella odontotermitis]KNC94184.1 autotransport protein MisL [Trabulsiella odontotermitis]
MPYPKKYSQIAVAVSAALASMVFTAQASYINFDSLPATGLVTDLPAEIQALIPAGANTSFAKNTSTPNYVYKWDTGSIPVYGNGLTLNGPGMEAFEHTVMVLQNSATGSPGVIFGDDLTIKTQSKVAANAGKDVDGIRSHGNNTPNNPMFVITGDRTTILVDGYSGDGINAGYNSYNIISGGYGSANIYVGNELYIKTSGYEGRGISVNAVRNSSSVKNQVIVGDLAHIVTTGDRAEGIRTGQNGSYVQLGDKATIETSGSTAHAVYAGSSSKIDIGNEATFKTSGDGANAVEAYSSSTLNVGDDATITIEGPNSSAVYAYSAATASIGDNATLSVDGASSHGVYAYYNNATVNVGDNVDITVNGTTKSSAYGAKTPSGLYAITRGKINLAGGAAITMAGTNSDQVYAMNAEGGGVIDASTGGRFTIDGDILANGGVAASGSTPAQISTITLNMLDGSVWDGASYIQTVTAGTGVIDLAMTNATWNMTDSSTVTNLTLNDGSTVNFQHAADTWQTLTVNNDFVGNGGTVRFNTVLFDDTSETDLMHVLGNTSGNAKVAVENIGGTGSQTIEGIKIIQVDGTSDGVFAKAGRIVAGAYDYDVVKKGNDWFLTSELTPEEPVDPVDPPVDPVDPVDPPVDPVDPVDPPEDPVKPVPPPTPASPEKPRQVRPEAGSYLANNYAANTLFMTRLHDRLGETQYTDVLTGEEKVTSMWMRNVGNHNRFKDSSGSLDTRSNSYVLQIGGDLAQWSTDGLDRWHLGAMAGYANSSNRTKSKLNGYASRGEVSGYSIGLYGTWYANEADKTGTYVDTWALYNWFNNKVTGQARPTEEYDSSGLTASVEAGYTFNVGESENFNYWIQPKAQLVWMDVQADDHREKNGTRIKDETDGNLLTRLGVRAQMNSKQPEGVENARGFQPFIEANWIHNTQDQSVRMDDVSVDMRGAKNIGELKIGVEGQITPRLTMWGNVAQQVGEKSYSNTQGMLGVKYSF